MAVDRQGRFVQKRLDVRALRGIGWRGDTNRGDLDFQIRRSSIDVGRFDTANDGPFVVVAVDSRDDSRDVVLAVQSLPLDLRVGSTLPKGLSQADHRHLGTSARALGWLTIESQSVLSRSQHRYRICLGPETLDQLAAEIGALETQLVLMRASCVNHWRDVLDADQFEQALGLAGY